MAATKSVHRKSGMQGLDMAKWLLSRSVTAENGCIEYNGYRYIGPYPTLHFEKKNRPSSRVMFKCLYGYYPECVCHTCDNPKCIRPSHLFGGTGKENMRDKLAKGRHGRSKGDSSPKKLNEESVRAIRKDFESGSTKQGLARKYGVSRRMIRLVVIRAAWRHVS